MRAKNFYSVLWTQKLPNNLDLNNINNSNIRNSLAYNEKNE